MRSWEHWKVIREHYDWGQPLVFDLSFLTSMSFKNVKSVCQNELVYALKRIRQSREPFQVIIFLKK